MQHLQMIEEKITTGKVSNDWLKLGRTSGKRSAEIVAGLRAVSGDSSIDKALSSPMGRLLARVLTALNNDAAMTNATLGRHLCMTRLAHETLQQGPPPKVIVELAAGFSARGLLLAQTFPEAEVIEVDLPEVVDAKQARIRRLLNGAIPPNLRWLTDDLAEVALSDVLGDIKVDLLIAEGLLPYFPPNWITKIAASVRKNLAPSGVMIADVVSSHVWEKTEGKSGLAVWLLKRQIGKFHGKAENSSMAKHWFKRAGYAQVQASPLTELAGQYLPHMPVAGVSFIVRAYKTKPAVD